MSKSLEKEYKEYIQMETPDLWDRIEKELLTREQQAGTQNILQDKMQPKKENTMLPSEYAEKGRKNNIRKWSAYGSLAAAAVVVIVCLPFLHGETKSSETASDMCAVETAGGTVEKDNAALFSEDAVSMEMAEDEGILEEIVEVTVTISEISVNEEGVCLYTGVTESKEEYIFTVDEDVVETQYRMIEGESYSVELVKDGDVYRVREIVE